MSEREIGLGRLFVQEAIKAGTWGLILLIVTSLFLATVKQDIKEGIAYSVDRFISNAVSVGTHPVLIGKAKQLVKEGIEYSVTKAGKEARGVIRDASQDKR
jgi:hypothetical protein